MEENIVGWDERKSEIKNWSAFPDKSKQIIIEDEERTQSFYFRTLADVRKFRVTAIEEAERCGRQWHLRNIRSLVPINMARTPNLYSAIGKIAHAILDYYIQLKGLGIEAITGEEYRILMTSYMLLTQNVKDGHKEVENLAKTLLLVDSLLEEYNIISTEKEYQILNFNLSEQALGRKDNLVVPLLGQIDCIAERKKDGRILCIDWKTSRRKDTPAQWKSRLQPSLYAYSVMTHFDLGVHQGMDFWIGGINTGGFIKFMYNIGDMMNIEVRANNAVGNILSGEERYNHKCDYCVGRRNCRTYMKGKEAEEGWL